MTDVCCCVWLVGPYPCVASALPTEPSPPPSVLPVLDLGQSPKSHIGHLASAVPGMHISFLLMFLFSFGLVWFFACCLFVLFCPEHLCLSYPLSCSHTEVL